LLSDGIDDNLVKVETYPLTPKPVRGNFKMAGKISRIFTEDEDQEKVQLSPIIVEVHYGYGTPTLVNKFELSFDAFHAAELQTAVSNI
jgi:hypothetical protein